MQIAGTEDALCDVMLRAALVLFVAGIASALLGLAGGSVLAIVARVGFYVLIPLALVIALAGLVRRPKRDDFTGDRARAGR